MHFDESFWAGISVIIFIAIIYKPLSNFIAKSLDTKINKITEEIKKSEGLKLEAERLLKELNSKKQSTEKLIAEMTQDAEEQIKIIYTQQENTLQRAIREKSELATQRINAYQEDILNSLRIQAVNIGIAAATNIIKENRSTKFSSDLIDELANDLKSKI